MRGNSVAISSLEKQNRAKRSQLSIDIKQPLIGQTIAKLENLKDTVRECFVQVSVGYSAGLQWREVGTAFESRILTDAVINSGHIETSPIP